MPTLSQLKNTILLEPYSLHHALCTLLIISLTYIYLYYQPSPQASWLLLSSILLSQAGLRAELNWQSLGQTLFYPLCGLLAAAAVLALSLSADYFLLALVFIALITFLSNYLAWHKRQFFFAAFSINLLAILAYYYPCELPAALERSELIVLGSLLVLIIRAVFFFYRRRNEFLYARVIFLQKLKHFYQLIFYISGLPHSILGQELEESHFQAAWSDCLSALQRLKKETGYYSKLQRILDISLSLGSLRYRLTDYTILTMSHDEMLSLSNAIITIVNQLIRNQDPISFQALQSAIQQFEELYRSMLQAVAKEPLAVLLFIHDLYALKEEFEQLPTPSTPASPPKQSLGGETHA